MNKNKIIALVLIIGALAGAGLYFQNISTTNMKDKNITVVDDTKKIKPDESIISKIDVYEDIMGYGWINDDNIIVTEENKNEQPMETGVGTFEVRNLKKYNLNNKESKNIANEKDFQEEPLVSPDQKHVFYSNRSKDGVIGYIADMDGNVKVKIDAPNLGIADFSEASWVNNEEIIMPYIAANGLYTVKVDGSTSKIENIEKGVTGLENPLNGISIMSPVKVGNKIYYVISHNGSEDHDKMKVYDIEKNESKEFIKEKIVKFKLRPDKKQFMIVTLKDNDSKIEVMLSDLDGKNQQVIGKGGALGENWSPDGKKMSYITDGGVYIYDLETKKTHMIAAGEYYEPTSWSPSGKKIMVHSVKNSTGKQEHLTTVITLK